MSVFCAWKLHFSSGSMAGFPKVASERASALSERGPSTEPVAGSGAAAPAVIAKPTTASRGAHHHSATIARACQIPLLARREREADSWKKQPITTSFPNPDPIFNLNIPTRYSPPYYYVK